MRKPRLREKGRGPGKEVAIPAYEAMQDDRSTCERMLALLLDDVSTRRYREVIPAMAETVGVSRSTVSREAIAASEAAQKRLAERHLEGLDLLVIYGDL